MALSFTKSLSSLKSAGLPKTSLKLTAMAKDRKLPSISVTKLKIPNQKSLKDFNFSKFTKMPKLPKAPKIAIIKKAIKKVKNVGF